MKEERRRQGNQSKNMKEGKLRKEKTKTQRNHLPQYFIFYSLTRDRKPCQETYVPQRACNYMK